LGELSGEVEGEEGFSGAWVSEEEEEVGHGWFSMTTGSTESLGAA
jgi:hypothetical protein